MPSSPYLQRPRIIPTPPDLTKTISTDIINSYKASGAYNAGRLAEACAIYKQMITDDATICLTIAGALTPTGMGRYIIPLIKNGLVDFIISTGANLYHDLHFALDLPVHQGDFRINDTELLKENIVRIYDIFLPEETLLKTDQFIQQAIQKLQPTQPLSTTQLHYHLGAYALNHTKHPEYSLLATAAKYHVPIFTPSPADSSIGMNLALEKTKTSSLVIDTDLDILESTAYVYHSKKNGSVQLGGGAPKNFYMQTQPMLSQIMNFDRGGHDYFIQITADSPHWGGLSGATPSEAISWKKVKPSQVKNDVVVYADVTIAAPLLFSYILSNNYTRPHKKLFSKRTQMLTTLQDALDKK